MMAIFLKLPKAMIRTMRHLSKKNLTFKTVLNKL